jgi:hypothetical protein
MLACEAAVTCSRSNQREPEGCRDVSGVAERVNRSMNAATGEALLVTTEDLARLVLQPEWTAIGQAQMRDLARHAMAIINAIGTPRER